MLERHCPGMTLPLGGSCGNSECRKLNRKQGFVGFCVHLGISEWRSAMMWKSGRGRDIKWRNRGHIYKNQLRCHFRSADSRGKISDVHCSQIINFVYGGQEAVPRVHARSYVATVDIVKHCAHDRLTCAMRTVHNLYCLQQLNKATNI